MKLDKRRHLNKCLFSFFLRFKHRLNLFDGLLVGVGIAFVGARLDCVLCGPLKFHRLDKGFSFGILMRAVAKSDRGSQQSLKICLHA